MKNLNSRIGLLLWTAYTVYLKSNELTGRKKVKQALIKVTAELEQAEIVNMELILTTDGYYTVQYEYCGLQIVKQIHRGNVSRINKQHVSDSNC